MMLIYCGVSKLDELFECNLVVILGTYLFGIICSCVVVAGNVLLQSVFNTILYNILLI